MGRVPAVGEADDDALDVRLVHPFQARKTYVCPGCSHDINPGTGHFVVVPLDAPEDRRHWHKGCWQHRKNRRRRR